MSEKKNLVKDILVVPVEKIDFIKDGFMESDKKAVSFLEDIAEYKKRFEMEKDNNYRQLIPYIAIKKGDKIFVYQRSKKGGENRLYDKWTLGLGGHIDKPDNVIESILRELKEEVDLEISKDKINFIGFIKLNDTEVDMVHLGLAIIVEIENENLFDNGELDKIINRKFLSKNELEKVKDKFELWSKIFYEEYLRDIL